MKKLFYLVGICLLAVACKQGPKQLTLEATGISDNGDIFVYDVAEDNPIDTIKVADGNFTYTKEVGDETKLLVITNNTSMLHYLIAEKGNLTLAGDTGVIKGSPMNDRLAEFIDGYKKSGREIEDKKIAVYDRVQNEQRQPTEEEIAEIQALNKEQSTVLTEMAKKYYETDKENILGAFELMIIQNFLSDDEFNTLYEQGSEVVKNFPPFVKSQEARAKRAETSVGAKFLDFEGINPKNTDQTIKLSDFAGKDKYVLLDFWASWCGPCVKAMPQIKVLNDKYADKGLEVIGVVVSDQLENHLKSAEELSITWTQIFDSKNEIGTLYAIEGIPTLILLDKDGTILVRTHDKGEITEKIESLLGK